MLEYKRQQLKTNLAYVIVGLLILTLVLVTRSQLRNHTEATLDTTLSTILNRTLSGLESWRNKQTEILNTISNKPNLVDLAKKIHKLDHDKQSLIASPLISDLRNEMAPWVVNRGFLGLYLINKDGVNIGSLNNKTLGEVNPVKTHQPERWNMALSGKTIVTRPMPTDISVLGPDGRLSMNAPTMFVLSPILDEKGEVIAVLSVRINPETEFTPIFQRGANGRSGETYAFDAQATMLTSSRFESQLHKIGLLTTQQYSTLGIKILDPGRNLLVQKVQDISQQNNWPMTKMAKSATHNSKGSNFAGYRDYRGVIVIGVWSWNESFGLGITTEIDHSEAYEILEESLSAIYIFSGMALVLLAMMNFRHTHITRLEYERGDKYRIASYKAKEASHAKSLFLSSMSHELRTPLNAIIGFSGILKEDETITSQPILKEQIEYVSQAGDHLLRLVNGVLDMAKLDAGELRFQFEPVHLQDLIKSCAGMMSPQAKNVSIKINIDMPNNLLPPVWADITRTKQVLLNFLSNAIKYNVPNGSIQIKIAQVDNNIIVRVIDTGVGLSDEQLSMLWQPFNRLGAENSNIEGSGIGLAYAKNIIAKMHGEIGVTSEVGEGSCFWFSLPIAPASKEEKTSTSGTITHKEELTPDTSSLENKHILYVEAIEQNQKLVATILDHVPGLTLTFAADVKTACKVLSEEFFDMVILDVNLPDGSGMDIYTFSRERFITLRTPFVILTAGTSEETQQECLAQGINGYIFKPINVELFTNELDKIFTEFHSPNDRI